MGDLEALATQLDSAAVVLELSNGKAPELSDVFRRAAVALREAAPILTAAASERHAPGCQPVYCDCDESWEWPERIRAVVAARRLSPDPARCPACGHSELNHRDEVTGVAVIPCSYLDAETGYCTCVRSPDQET